MAEPVHTCDVAVVGRGLLGSAAARHLADLGADVAVIGPGEPAELASHNGVFANGSLLSSEYGRQTKVKKLQNSKMKEQEVKKI